MCSRSSDGPSTKGRRALGPPTVALVLVLIGLTACRDAPEDRRAEARAAAERQFGRPAGDEGPAGADTSPGTVAEAPPATPADTSGLADAAGGSGARETPPAARPPIELAGGEAVRDTVAGREVEAGTTAPPIRTPPAGDPTGGAAGRPGGEAADPDAILAAADRAYSALRSLRASFIQRVDVPLLDRTSQGHGIWYQEGRDRFRMDFDDPPDDVFVADGTYLWLYQPSANPNQVLRCELAEGRQTAGGMDVLGRILSEARASYDATYEGTAIVSGQDTHTITLRPRGDSEYRLVRVWVAGSDDLVRRFRIEEENETIRTVTLADLEPNVSLDDALFHFTPPPGVEPFAC